ITLPGSLSADPPHPELHPFPTRRSSDLPKSPKQDLSLFGNIPVKVTLEVASVEVSLKELLDVDANSVIQLDKVAGEPLDMKVNRSEEHTSELQSRENLVCRLLLEKKKLI